MEARGVNKRTKQIHVLDSWQERQGGKDEEEVEWEKQSNAVWVGRQRSKGTWRGRKKEKLKKKLVKTNRAGCQKPSPAFPSYFPACGREKRVGRKEKKGKEGREHGEHAWLSMKSHVRRPALPNARDEQWSAVLDTPVQIQTLGIAVTAEQPEELMLHRGIMGAPLMAQTGPKGWWSGSERSMPIKFCAHGQHWVWTKSKAKVRYCTEEDFKTAHQL